MQASTLNWVKSTKGEIVALFVLDMSFAIFNRRAIGVHFFTKVFVDQRAVKQIVDENIDNVDGLFVGERAGGFSGISMTKRWPSGFFFCRVLVVRGVFWEELFVVRACVKGITRREVRVKAVDVEELIVESVSRHA